MGFFGRLFGGGRETDAQKLERARQHLDDGEPALAAAIVERLSGPEADEVRRRARDELEAVDARMAEKPERKIAPDGEDLRRGAIDDGEPRPAKQPRSGDPYRDPAKQPKQPKQPKPPKLAPGSIALSYGADGSTTFTTSDGALTLNAPVSDDDGRPRSADAVDVARRILESTSRAPMDPRGFAFVEACVVLARSGDLLPALRHPTRRAIALLARVAHERDPAKLEAFVRSAAPDVAEDIAWFATPLAIGFAAHELGVLANAGLVKSTWMLIEALAKTEPATCAELVEKTGDPLFAGEALLFGDIPGIAWTDWREASANADEWRALEIRRLAARGDLDAALALEETHANECGPHYAATFDLARALAQRDAASATEKIAALEPIVDNAGWLAGLAREGHGAEVIDRWIDAIGPLTYDPFSHFAETVSACIALGDVDRTRRCIARGGPTGWQIACAAHDALAQRAASADAQALLAACYERVQPGVVAGRAIAHGAFPLGAGKMVIQPAWLAFTDPHPIETLALVAALGADMPRWPTLR